MADGGMPFSSRGPGQRRGNRQRPSKNASRRDELAGDMEGARIQKEVGRVLRRSRAHSILKRAESELTSPWLAEKTTAAYADALLT